MQLQEPKNANYAAVVVALSKFVDLPNCDNVKAALVFGNSIIVSKTAQVGELGLYFPVESQLSPEFLGANNLYRKPEWGNIDPNGKGFFEQHGRVKAVKFRGHKSEGFWIPIESVNYINKALYGPSVNYDSAYVFDLKEGITFDAIGDHEICRKYVPKCSPQSTKLRGRQPRLEDKIVEKQFRFHYDTTNLRRNISRVNPNDWISISDKWHGTSIVIANLLCKRGLRWYEKVLQFAGINVTTEKYGIIYSSRRVIKNVDGNTKANIHFYDEDIWGIVAKEVADVIPKGYTLYGEIVGFTPEGKEIQPGYHYGCLPKAHKLLVYRVTHTNPDGTTIELSWNQMKEFCTKYGLEMVKELWYGQAQELFGDLLSRGNNEIEWWQDNFLCELEKKYVTDQMCPYNSNSVPAEGIVVRIDRLDQSEAFKLKNFKFLEHESKLLDKGEADIETEESIEQS